jgi:signal transduction histidine kinase
VVSESLTTAVKHAKDDTVRIRAAQERSRLIVEVTDDGIGGADPSGGSGLRGLVDRVEALGGRLIVSSPEGQGTHVRAEIACV